MAEGFSSTHSHTNRCLLFLLLVGTYLDGVPQHVKTALLLRQSVLCTSASTHSTTGKRTTTATMVHVPSDAASTRALGLARIYPLPALTPLPMRFVPLFRGAGGLVLLVVLLLGSSYRYLLGKAR